MQYALSTGWRNIHLKFKCYEKINYFILMLFISFTACDEDLIIGNLKNGSSEYSTQNEIVTNENTIVTLDEARKIAIEFMHENSNSEIRSGKDNEILKAECIIEDNDTLMYLVNFENGFTLVSGSSATHPILGFEDQSNLYEDDINNNSDLSFCFEYVKGQIKETLKDTIIEYYDPLGLKDVTAYSQARIGVGESGRITGRVGEELCLIKTNWHQGPPFNNFTPYVGSNYSNGNAPAGCVAIAIGQILVYHKKMSNYSDWDKLANPDIYPDIYPETMVQFIKTIGAGVSMVYSKDGSHPKISTKVNLCPRPKDFFESVGYKVKSSNFSLNEIAYQLDKKIQCTSVGIKIAIF